MRRSIFAVRRSRARSGSYTDPSLTLCYDFAGRKTLTPLKGPAITFTRASSGTYFDSSGVLQTAANDAARFDHTALTGASSLGLLTEEARTHRALWNRDFTNAAWVKSNITPVKSATGIDAVSSSASTLTATDANGTALQTVTVSSAAFTFPVYVKRVTGTGDIDITDNNGTNWTTLTGLSSSVWTRHDITRTQANPVIGFRIVTSGDIIEVDFSGLEGGSFATSAVEVTSSTVTRAKDSATVTDVGWFAQSAPGTFYYEADTLDADAGGEDFIIEISDNSFSNYINSSHRPSSVIRFTGSGGISVQTANGFLSDGVPFKVAMGFDTNDDALGADGSIVATDTSHTLPGTTTQFDIGQDHNGGSTHNGHIAELKYWNVRKPNSFLTSITS